MTHQITYTIIISYKRLYFNNKDAIIRKIIDKTRWIYVKRMDFTIKNSVKHKTLHH